ncbi:MAG: putative Ig domain-containing protein, partial [Candidatus Omnitrophica bacterium]|nr:putative Ig domain-containing protein [Candidatus Omnitrophota bacterium]
MVTRKLISGILIPVFLFAATCAFAADTTPPTGTVKINNNAAYTNSPVVTLTLSAADASSGVSQMRLSNDNIVWAAPESYTAAKSWTLLSVDGKQYVCVKYKDTAGNWSGVFSTSILLDTISPTGAIKINNGAATATSLNTTLNLSAADGLSGVYQMQFSNDSTTWSAPEAYAVTKSWALPSGDGTKTVYARFQDKAGNWSTVYSDSIILNTLAPQIVTASLPDGIAQEEYREYLNAVGGTSPYIWSIESQKLPDGLTLDRTTGAISGISTLASTFNFVVKVTDAKLLTDTRSLSIKVIPAFPPITDEELLDQTEARGAMYFYNEAISNGFVKDTDYKDFSSISATGFGLAALCVMAERYQTTPNWTVSPTQARARVNQILDNCISYQSYQASAGNNYGVAGFLYHFITANGTRQG